jgi:hypothetical protein
MFGEFFAENFEGPFNELHLRPGLQHVIIPYSLFEAARGTLDPARVVVGAFYSHGSFLTFAQ